MNFTLQALAWQCYFSALTDAQRQLAEPFFRGNLGRPPPMMHSRPEVVNAILYLARTGVQWRYLPDDFPNWQRVHSYCRQWKKEGTFISVHNVLCGKARKKTGARHSLLLTFSTTRE